MTVQNVKCIWRYDIQKTMRYYFYKGRFHPKFIIVHSKLMDSIILGGVLMDSMRTPQGLHKDSMGTPWGLLMDSTRLWRDYQDFWTDYAKSMRSPWGHVGTVKYRKVVIWLCYQLPTIIMNTTKKGKCVSLSSSPDGMDHMRSLIISLRPPHTCFKLAHLSTLFSMYHNSNNT